MKGDLERRKALFEGETVFVNPFTGRLMDSSKDPGCYNHTFVEDAELLRTIIDLAYNNYGEPITRKLLLVELGSRGDGFSTEWAPWAFSDRFGRFTKYLELKDRLRKEGKGWVSVD